MPLARASITGLFLATVAAAQSERPAIMSAPLLIRRVPAGVTAQDKERLQREFTRQLKLAGAQVPEFARSEAALKGFAWQACERNDDCLAELARRGQVLYGLFASLDVTIEGQLVLQARVVRDDGVASRPPVTVSVPTPKSSFVEGARAPMAELFSKLDLAALPLQRAVAVAPQPVEPPPPPVAPPPPQPLPAPAPPTVVLVPASPAPTVASGPLALVIAGGAVALLGAAVGLVGFVTGSGLATKDGLLRDANDVGRHRTASLLATGGLVGFGVGAASAITGVILLATGRPAVALAPLSGGGFVSLGGSW